MDHPALPEPERQLGKYHIVRPLKVGGTAAIYLAVLRGENNFSREVVIKRPLPHLVADNRARLMFIDEAHIASRLSHPNICQVLDLVARSEELYLVLEYLRGVDLREVLKRSMELGRLIPIEVCAWIAIEVCAGLDFAHEAVAIDGTLLNLIHRDVSPKNIRLTDAGSVKVIDFGIARAMNRATETAAGTIKGTLGYMSPEQIMGDEIDRRSDIFAFGICLFQMLTCRNPFDGPTLKERVRRLTQAPVPSPREFNAALDPEIEGIVMKCLERDLDARYQRMRDVQVDLDRYLAKLQVVSPRQKLIDFLEEIFPSLHETDPELKLALTEISTVTGKIDTSQRLRFPDDPEHSSGTSPTSASAQSASSSRSAATRSAAASDTVSTIKDEQVSRTAQRAAPNGQAAHDTLLRGDAPRSSPNADASALAGQAGATIDGSSSISTVLASRPIRLGGVGLILAIAAALAALTVIWWSDHRVSTSPIGEESPAQAAPYAPEREGYGAIARTEARTSPTPGIRSGAEPNSAHALAEARGAGGKPNEEAASPAAPGPKPNAEGSSPTAAEPVPAAHPANGAEASKGGKRANGSSAGSSRIETTKDRARLYFLTGARLENAGKSEEALFMYVLAFSESGKNVNPAIYKNLGILFHNAQEIAKAKACFRAYIERNPGAPDAEVIHGRIGSYPATKTVACVDGGDVQRARKRLARAGAVVDSWVNETIQQRLR
jgi:eukaryotic-like serine/threonine-protein kinase